MPHKQQIHVRPVTEKKKICLTEENFAADVRYDLPWPGAAGPPRSEELDRSGTNVDTWKMSAFIAMSSASRSAS